MNKLLKNIKKVVSIMLVMSMIFTSHAFVTFAEGVDDIETTIEETTVEADNEIVGANSVSPEEDIEETTTETTVAEEEAGSVDEDSKETTVGENIEETTVVADIIRPEDDAEDPTETTDYAEEPEEDVKETETIESVGANSVSPEEEKTIDEVENIEGKIEELQLDLVEETKVNNDIYGDDPKCLDYIDIASYTIKTYYVGDKYDTSNLKIKAYYTDGSYEIVPYDEVNKSKFSFSPDCVNNPFTASTTDENPYELTITYDDGTNDSFVTQAFQVHPAPTTTYTVQYNQNLPAGYTLSGGMTWYTDSTTTDLTGSPIILKGSDDMTCEDTSGNVRTLQGWNAQSELAGNKFNFGDTFNDPLYFDPDPICTLYAMWSDPVAPGPTAFAYWIVTGDGDNKTIHYYATPGTGRTAVVIGTDGIEYTGLETSEKVIIKKAVIEEPIVATDVRSYFKDFKGLGSITNLGNLDTSNATSFKSMFEHCEAIKKIETSGLETDSLTDTSYMFTYCNSATDIILGDNFDTSNVTSMREMFNTTGAVELDLTKFETSKVTDMYGMFSSCENLETIRVSDKFVVDKVSTSSGKFMFANCDKLVGEKGTKIADLSSPFGVTYAHIDEGSTNPGLFSGASTPPTTYTVKYNQDLPTGYTLSGGMTWYTDSTTTDLTGNPIILKGSADMTCEDTSGNTRTLQSWNTQIEHKGNTFNFGAEFKDSQYFDPDPTCTLYAMWSDPVAPGPTPPGPTPPGPTPPGPTPPGPTPPSPGGGGTGGGTSGGGSSDPAHGPLGDLTKELQQQQQQKATDKKQAKKVENDELADLLKSYNENHDAPMVNARDDNGNVGFGQWLRIPGSTIWYFLTSDFNQNVTNVNSNAAPNPTQTANQNKTEGFLVDGWFNLGWDGVDRWYRFDENGIMLMGWWIEDGKTYFLQTDENDNWYGKAMTGTQVIDGITYNFDENGVLIQ